MVALVLTRDADGPVWGLINLTQGRVVCEEEGASIHIAYRQICMTFSQLTTDVEGLDPPWEAPSLGG